MANENKDFIKLDDIDVSILKIINEDVRTSYRQISRSLDVSVGTVHNRIDKMVKSGVIKKFSPVIDHEILGYVLTTIIGVRVKGGKLKNWEEKTYFNKNVVGIYDVTGEYDAFLIAKFKDTNELNTFIKDLVKDPNIERTYTQTVLDVIKELIFTCKKLPKISLKYISFKKHNIKNNYMIEVIKWQFVYLTPKMILPAYLSN